MRRWLVAAALLVAACGEQAPAPGEAQTASAPMGAASTPGNVIGPSGAAGITTSLPMNADAVRAVVAGYAIASVEDQVEGDPFTAITLSDGSEEVFRLLPTADDHIHAITTRSARARGPAGEVVGQTLFGVAPPEQVEFCLSEFVEGAGLCLLHGCRWAVLARLQASRRLRWSKWRVRRY
ncbi:MAG: hypothetical protein R3C25_04035 [Hyphomonadaceae bacterium]